MQEPLVNDTAPERPSVVSGRESLLSIIRRRRPRERRFLDRDGSFKQSRGVLNIKRENTPVFQYYFEDWASLARVHTLLHKSTTYLIVTLTLVYIASFLVFAPFYWAVSEDCGLELDTFGEAVFISLETMTTIGFGVPRDYMDGCGSGMLIVTVQSVFSVLVSAVTIGGFWLRVSRPQTRANSIAFSDKAVVQEIRGALYLMFQVVELRKHQLTEAKVRCYTLSQRPSLGMAAMRLHRPDDQLGSMLLLSLPAVVVHRIDNWSPLSPTPAGLAAATAAANAEMLENAEGGGSRPSGARVGRNSQRGSGVASGAASGQLGESVGPSGPGARVGAGVGGGGGAAAAAGAAGAGGEEATAPHHHDPSVSFLFPDVAQRISDVESGNREARGAASDPTFAGHHSTGAPGVPGPGGPGGAGGGKHFGALALDARDMAAKRRAVAEWLQASGAEVLAVVEGEENITGCTCQARHSYTADDITWDMTFAPCVFLDKDEGGFVVDFDKFHDLVPVGSDGAPAGGDRDRGERPFQSFS